MRKINFFKQKPAFTLAEVLITLTIIGVIAAMVIPTLLQKHLEQEMITKLKKNFSVFSNAYTQAIRENGSPEEWDIAPSSKAEGSEKLYNYLKPYLKVEKECGSGTGCFADSYKTFSGYTSTWSNMDSDDRFYHAILSDGTSVIVMSKGCANVTATVNTGEFYVSKNCGSILVDLNNKKGPNKFGIDVFRFRLGENKIIPSGIGNVALTASDGSACHYNGTHKNNGALCAAHVIYKGNMDYLRREIEDEWR